MSAGRGGPRRATRPTSSIRFLSLLDDWRARALAAAAIVGVAVVATLLFTVLRSGDHVVLFAPRFPAGSTLVTNEFATYNPRAAGAVRSASWISTSGSLFARDGGGYSGVPDDGDPNATSSSATGSSVFRLVSRRRDFGDVSIRMRLRVDRLLDTPESTDAWDGVHVFARYQSEDSLYVVSVSRRDGSVVAKKKLPGGTSNGGTYVQIGETVHDPLAHGLWHDVRLDVANDDGGVRLVLHLDGLPVLDVVDRGIGGPAITEPGRVGLRGDLCEFDFDRFSVRSL